MTLAAGTSLSHYRLVEKIGEGGMGVVWKATDTTLGRNVAIKVLPDAFARDPERVARFEREAKLLASLNHPHIAAIYGLEAGDGVRFLALELVEGDDLAARLRSGALPVPEALAIARQIAEALETAHERGIVHRDLKPANVVIHHDGRVKLLDFGLARAFEGDPTVSGTGAAMSPYDSPTLTAMMTGAHVILGTAAYMSPEQARGRTADKRSDIWAFGVVLYEMLTGRQLFDGETISDTLASVLKSDPEWSALPAETPPRIRERLVRCMARDPRRRLRDIGEARITIEDVLTGRGNDSPVGAPAAADAGGASGTAGAIAPGKWRPMSKRMTILVTIAASVLGAVAATFASRALSSRDAELPVRRFRLPVTSEQTITGAALSPDGRAAAYVAGDGLWVQELDRFEPRELAHETGIQSPFWSPDSKWIAYVAGPRIVKVSITDGARQVVAQAAHGFTGGAGASWQEDGTIVASRAESDGLLEVSALGGDVRVVLPPDTTQESDFHEPHALPGGKGVLFISHRRIGGMDNIALYSGGRRTTLLELPGQSLTRPVYSATGHILFERQTAPRGIWALPFSHASGKVTGEPFLVVTNGHSATVAGDGTLLYVGREGTSEMVLQWANAGGAAGDRVGEVLRGADGMLGLSRDGSRVAVGVLDGETQDLWVCDTARGTRTRLTFDPGRETWPSWSPDGRWLVYHATAGATPRGADFCVLIRPADGSGVADTLARGAGCASFTPDGKAVVFSSFAPEGRVTADWELQTVHLEGDRRPTRFLKTKGYALDARVSPDGRFVAYVGDESGRHEIYLKPFPSGEGRWQISVDGGTCPRWNARGDRLYFARGEDILGVDVALGTVPTLGAPRKLYARKPIGVAMPLEIEPLFDVTADGSKFLFLGPSGETSPAGASPRAVTVVQNWFAEFRRKP